MRSKEEVSVIRCWHSADDPLQTFGPCHDQSLPTGLIAPVGVGLHTGKDGELLR